MIEVVFGNILDCDVDAIVNASDKKLTGGGGIDKIIHRAAGSELRNHLSGKQLENVGDALLTPGCNLKAKYIVHTAGPRCYDSAITNQKRIELARCYSNCLEKAKEAGIKSIAFPCISTGVYKFPKQEAARIAVSTVQEWLSKEPDSIQVYFVCFSKEDYNYYMNNCG